MSMEKEAGMVAFGLSTILGLGVLLFLVVTVALFFFRGEKKDSHRD